MRTIILYFCIAINFLIVTFSVSVQANAKDALPKPFIEQRADPCLYKSADGNYYFVATTPEYDRIELRAAKTIAGISNSPGNVIWRKHATGKMGAHIWAPEILRMDGVWYIYFAAGDAENIWNIRMYALSNTSADPTQGNWEELGQIKTSHDSFALDATVLEHKNKRYYLWAQYEGKESVLKISELINPIVIAPKETIISTPTFDWETQGYRVNEGPAVLVSHGKVFVSYSASATDDRYAMGLVWADENADLLDSASWHKSPVPMFSTNEKFYRYGPGHNSFVKSENDKKDILVYHARTYKELQGTALSDPNRNTYLRTIKWPKNGFPDFGQDKPNDLKIGR